MRFGAREIPLIVVIAIAIVAVGGVIIEGASGLLDRTVSDAFAHSVDIALGGLLTILATTRPTTDPTDVNIAGQDEPVVTKDVKK